MNLIRLALSNPVAVVVAVLLVLLFGTINLLGLPVQMTPDVAQPQIQISTNWRAAAPEEIEVEIVEPQEDALRGVPGVRKMESNASRGNASINLTFDVEVDLRKALIEVMNRLNRVPAYPPDALEPVIFAGQGQFDAIAWFGIRPVEGNTRDIASYQDFIEEVVQSRIERIPGVANSDAYGGRPNELRITFDPYKAAALGVDLPTLIGKTSNNVDVSGGFTDVGRRQYTVRYAGAPGLGAFGDVVLAWRDGNPVLLRDVADVEVTMVDKAGRLSQDGGPSIAVNAQPEKGINVLSVMKNLKAEMADLNEGVLKRAGLKMNQAYDESLYIQDSIAMLRNNLLFGVVLAIGVLWWFLRKFRATLIVALSIPIALFVTFSFMGAAGRTLNIISLAGLAFSVGMVLDAAIVVLENIVRLRESGESSKDAAYNGATQVGGALVASVATTVAIFLPIVFLNDLAAQLFADLALAISIAVVASLVSALTVIPTAATTWLRRVPLEDPHTNWWDNGTGAIMRLTDTKARRTAWIVGLISVSLVTAWALKPSADYLPDGKQNFVFAFILPPPGLSTEAAENEIASVIDQRMIPYLEGEKEPLVSTYFLGIFGSFGFMGARAADGDDIDNLVNAMNGDILAGFPDTMPFASRRSIFAGYGADRRIELDIQTRDIDAALRAALVGMGATMQALPGDPENGIRAAQVRPIPGVELAEPELRLVPDERRINESGFSRQQMASIIRALGDGLFVGDYFDGERSMDIVLRGSGWDNPEQLTSLPLATPARGIQPLGELVRIERTAGPDQIRRVDRRRTVTLQINPPQNMPLEVAIQKIRDEVEPAIRAQLPEDGDVIFEGSADDLSLALKNMGQSLALAIVILYLLMSALFRSFRDSLLVLISLPLAIVGGVISLRVTNLVPGVFQPMDLLTMIGFITLLGIVVNNAILLVHQTRAAERNGLGRRDAVEQAVRIRLRPILMSTLTSLFGMLPLLLIPGPGTEIYRGLAAVIVGGLSVSTIFTLILLPSLLRLGESSREGHIARPGELEGQYV